jgi:hypothetical protein
MGNETIVQKLREDSGVRLKALGDGKSWLLQFTAEETNTDYCHYQTTIATRNGRVVEINLPYTRLRQPNWGKRTAFNKNNILYLVFQRGSDTQSGTSIIKVFDFEIY